MTARRLGRFVRRAFPLGGALAALLLAAGGAAAQDDPECRARVDGAEARVWIAGVWLPLADGPLPAGAAKIATGEEARVEIACADGLVVTIGVSCEINMDTLVRSARDRSVVLQLVRGIFGVVLPERPTRGVQTRTPLALAAARGTAWLATYDGEDHSAFFARDGVVEVRTGVETARLTPGEGVDVRNGALGPVVDWGAPRIEASRAALGFGWR